MKLIVIKSVVVVAMLCIYGCSSKPDRRTESFKCNSDGSYCVETIVELRDKCSISKTILITLLRGNKRDEN